MLQHYELWVISFGKVCRKADLLKFPLKGLKMSSQDVSAHVQDIFWLNFCTMRGSKDTYSIWIRHSVYLHDSQSPIKQFECSAGTSWNFTGTYSGSLCTGKRNLNMYSRGVLKLTVILIHLKILLIIHMILWISVNNGADFFISSAVWLFTVSLSEIVLFVHSIEVIVADSLSTLTCE